MDGWLRTVRAGCCAGLLVCGGCGRELAKSPAAEPFSPPPMTKVPQVNATLELSGSGLSKPTVFAFERLASMEMTKLDDVVMLKTHADNETASWEGVPLDALLAAAQIKPGDMALKLYAADRYSIRATLADLKDAIIALRDGQGRWLADLDPKCPLRLVPPHQPGNYWIMNLALIEVEPVKTAGAPR